jgi:3-oxoacyl-[acyl-carrier protein] reductase
MKESLSGKIAFITGGSRSIGAAIVRALAFQGAIVRFTYAKSADSALQLVQEIESQGGNIKSYCADNGERGAVSAAIEDVAAEFGRIDVLINNAATIVFGNVLDAVAQAEEYQNQLNINFGAVTEAVRSATGHMQSGGRIINIGSYMANRVTMPNLAEYAATKGAIAAYTRGLAWDLGPRNITVNVVEPGPITTEGNPGIGEFHDLYRENIPLRRYGTPDEVASVVLFLAGDGASFISGSVIPVDGGINA